MTLDALEDARAAAVRVLALALLKQRITGASAYIVHGPLASRHLELKAEFASSVEYPAGIPPLMAMSYRTLSDADATTHSSGGEAAGRTLAEELLRVVEAARAPSGGPCR